MPAFPFHNQEIFNYCGPACLMMALESQEASLTGMFQVDLKSEIGDHDPTSDLHSPPEGIVAVANLRLGQIQGCLVRYQVYVPPPPDPGAGAPAPNVFAETIRTSLQDTEAPVFVLTESGGHWILVYKYNSAGFAVRNPGSPKFSLEAQRAHGAPCGLCGSGRNVALSRRQLLAALRQVSTDYPSHHGRRIMLVPMLP